MRRGTHVRLQEVVVVRVTRRLNSKSGNPVKELHTEGGTFVTSPDSACAYSISDDWNGQRAELTLNDLGHVIAFQELS